MFEGEEAASHPWSYAVRKPWCALRPSFAHVSWPVRFSIHACGGCWAPCGREEPPQRQSAFVMYSLVVSSAASARARLVLGRRAEGCVSILVSDMEVSL